MQSEDEYPLLKLNAASWEVMQGKRTVRLVRLADASDRRQRRQPGALPEGADAGLFEELRTLRRTEAARAEIQPYQVFPDNVLAELARGRPDDRGGPAPRLRRRRLQAAIVRTCLLDGHPRLLPRTGLPTDVPASEGRAALAAPRTGMSSPAKSLAFELFRRRRIDRRGDREDPDEPLHGQRATSPISSAPRSRRRSSAGCRRTCASGSRPPPRSTAPPA